MSGRLSRSYLTLAMTQQPLSWRTALEVLGAVVGPTKKSDTGRRWSLKDTPRRVRLWWGVRWCTLEEAKGIRCNRNGMTGLSRRRYSSSFCTFKGRIYYFPKDNFADVVCLEMSSGKSTCHFTIWFYKWLNNSIIILSPEGPIDWLGGLISDTRRCLESSSKVLLNCRVKFKRSSILIEEGSSFRTGNPDQYRRFLLSTPSLESPPLAI